MKYSLYIPEAKVEAMKKLASKVEKNIEGASITFSKPYEKVFKHHVNTGGHIKMTHVIRDVVVEFPEQNKWSLLVSYEDGMSFVTNPTEELKLKNPQHGPKCNHCDVCGHWMKNSFVIYNSETGEELQIGGECVKKYGINYLKTVAGFTRELYMSFDFAGCCTDEEYPYWGGYEDKSAFMSIEAVNLFAAAKKHYDEYNGVWKKGYYDCGVYYSSFSSTAIKDSVIDGVDITESDKEYYKNICEYIKSTISCTSEFSIEMLRVCSDFYVRPSDGAYAFFSIKNYEEHMEAMKLNLAPVSEGSFAKVTGKIINKTTKEGYYGLYTIYEIKTSKGYTAFRTGSVPYEERDNEKIVDFYAFVKAVDTNGKLTLDRALKRAKKGFDVIQL